MTCHLRERIMFERFRDQMEAIEDNRKRLRLCAILIALAMLAAWWVGRP